ncbi:hypothetical protein EJB05_28972 [Eragrostis curvula]|uniref:F-box domain-containing protein n=1 Tax=Eragrostis curvula TaxID=38414 RepID=A0A5J9USB7_9POAL|nr:hypothetical protein EJB05_28972 [Eragrostis curvula]
MFPWKNGKKASIATGRDGIDALPDGVLEHILGFLPAQEAVQTCVLARRWSHLWKSATALHIMCVGPCGEEPTFLVERQKFVDNLLRVRGLVPLERCELRIGSLYQDDDIIHLVHWIQHVVLCQVKMLRVDNVYLDGIELNDLSLVSSHLTRLEVIGISLNNDLCDLSGCPSLEYLEFGYCNFWCTTKISSVSLKYLSITSCGYSKGFNTLIYTPRLVSLRLDDHWCRAPCFEIIPSLHDAFVRVTGECVDCCLDDDSRYCPVENCFICDSIEHDSSKCLNLDGLSKSENLSWIVESKMFISKRDLKKWPTFRKLKTLLLNEQWCVPPDFHALTCILKHSPVLEKLTLQLFCKGHKHKFGMKGVRNSMDISAAISEHLMIVEVKSAVIDESILKVLKFLSTLNFRFSLDEVEILED